MGSWAQRAGPAASSLGSETVILQRVGQVAVPVKDLDRAVAFSRDVLGLRFLFQAPPGLACFDCGGVRVMLTLPEGTEPNHAASIVYSLVENL